MDELISSKEATKITEYKPRSASAHSLLLVIVGLLAIGCLVLLVMMLYALFSNSTDLGGILLSK
jgi:hypothetical protein